ncbi:MAG TPA: flagellar hook-associated protein FlgL [Verrucomicrobiae bacterium]|jgi:flagellar hook-associated protein 3 FlgL|nr:flagellar hook-associated protein FlgL [Verrucomicrobiae bacterium]
MSIRINPDPSTDLLAAIALNRQAQNTALQQLSSGRSVNQLSDNPAAASEDVLNHVQTNQDTQLLQNLSSLTSQGQAIDSTLNSAVQAVTQAISLGVEGANGTLSDAHRQAIAQELIGIRDQVLGLANQTYQGNYVFSGTATSTQPFVLDNTQPDGVKYNGNANVNTDQISQGQTVAVNLPGNQIFTNPSGDVLGALNGLITALQNNSGIAAANTNLDKAFTVLTTQRVFYGNALNQFQTAQTFLNGDKTQLAQQENSLVGADLAASITNFEQATTATNAILNATNQILTTLNLLNYLK